MVNLEQYFFRIIFNVNFKYFFFFFRTAESDYKVTSDHGYDYLTDSMHTIFFSRGPNIKSGLRLLPFQNVELFNFFAGLFIIYNY